MNLSTYNPPFGVIFISIIVGIFACTSCLTQILEAANPGAQDSFMTLIYIGTLAVIVIYVGLLQKSNPIRYNKHIVIMAILLILYRQFTVWFAGVPYTESKFFYVFTISSLMIPAITSIDTKVFLQTIMYISSLGFPYIDRMFVLDYNGAISMGSSYAFLISVTATIVYMLTYWKKENKMIKALGILASFVNLLYFIQLVTFGSRGPVFGYVCLFVFFYCAKITNDRVLFNKAKIIPVIAIAIFLVIAFMPSLMFLYEFLKGHFGIDLRFIQKFIDLAAEGDASNGRSEILDYATSRILENPLFGHGMDMFWTCIYGGYPHNFIVQAFYDMGVIIPTIFFIYLYKKLKKTFIYFNYDQFILTLILFFASVPGALFSDDLWNNGRLWLFFGCVLSNTFTYNKKLKNDEFPISFSNYSHM